MQGNVVFQPNTGALYEVLHVFEHQLDQTPGQVALECKNGDGETCMLPADSVLHLGFLIDAHMNYNEKVSFVKGDTTEQILPNLLAAITHHLQK